MDPNTEIRKLRPGVLWHLAGSLSDYWKTLLDNVLKEGTENVRRFNTEHIRLIEQAAQQQQKSAAEVFLVEWGTMGRQRPTLKLMLDLLVKAQLFRVADYVAVDLLKQPPPERPASGPAAEVRISDEELLNLSNTMSSLDSVLNRMDYPSQLSVNSAVHHREEPLQKETRVLEMECIERVSQLAISPANEDNKTSNHMQFDKSNVQNPTENSDLIRFSTHTIPSLAAIELHKKFPLANSVCNTRSCSASTSSTSTSDSRSVVDPSRTTFELQTSELPLVVANIGRGSTRSRSELRLDELPPFVVEIAQQGSDRSETSADTGSFGEPILFKSSSVSNENTELLSADLPQFVAALGHRQSPDNFTETSDGSLELADESSNGVQYTRPFVGRSNESSSNQYQYLVLNSEESRLVVSEGNEEHRQLDENLRELESAELPIFVAQL